MKDFKKIEIKKNDIVEQIKVKDNDSMKRLRLLSVKDKYIRGYFLNSIAEFESVKTGRKISFYVSRFNDSLEYIAKVSK